MLWQQHDGRWSEIQIRQAQTRQKYIPLFEKVIPGRKVALFSRSIAVFMYCSTKFYQVPLILQ
jgi:hypothetical protein